MPSRGDPSRIGVLPVRMDMERLAILLDVIGGSRPKSGDFEKAPPVGGYGFRGVLPRLPAPQAVQADALARGSRFPMGLVQVPDDFDVNEATPTDSYTLALHPLAQPRRDAGKDATIH